MGKTLARRFAGEPIVLYRGASGQVFALEDRCAHRQVPLHLGVVSGDELKCHYHGWTYDCTGKCVSVPYLGKERLPNGVRSYPAREVDGLIFVFPAIRRWRRAACPRSLGSSQRKDYKTRRLNREVACHYTFMHENLFDMNHQFMHRKQMGSIRAAVSAASTARTGRRSSTASAAPTGKQSVGEQVIVDLMRKRGEAKKDFSDHMRIRTDYPTQSLKVWVGRDIQESRRSGAGRVARLHAARCRAAHQPHLRLSVGEEAADAGADPRGVAVRHLVHREHLPRGQGHRGVRAAGAMTRRARTGTTRCFRRMRDLRACSPAAASR